MFLDTDIERVPLTRAQAHPHKALVSFRKRRCSFELPDDIGGTPLLQGDLVTVNTKGEPVQLFADHCRVCNALVGTPVRPTQNNGSR